MPYEKNMQNQMNLTYQPMIVGAAQIQYSEPKAKIDTMMEKVFLTLISDKPIPVNWDESNEVNIKVSDLKIHHQKIFLTLIYLQLL
jgi:hypothetical protein